MEIRQALQSIISTFGLDRLDAQCLLLHTLGRPASDRAWLLAHDTEVLAPVLSSQFITLAQRRASGVPLSYLTGEREFYGLSLQVDERVLDPRADTETLVDWALELLPQLPPQPKVIDLGTGSGAIALAIKFSFAPAQVKALDTSLAALAVARENAKRLRLDLQFLHGNWLEGLDDQFNLIVSNPPYIAENDPHLSQLGYEPSLALSSGADGLDAIRTLLEQAPSRLATSGWLILEHGWDQAATVRHLLQQTGFSQVQSRRDLAGIERCSAGCWAG